MAGEKAAKEKNASAKAGDEREFVKDIADRNSDFPQWYTDVVLRTGLVDYGPVRGSMVIRPYGFALWENMQVALDRRIKATGHENAYFPLLIPESLLRKEAEHVEGFAPEVAWVTHGGGEELTERLVVRPTSETVICAMYAKWIGSWRDLPVLINQWANVVRWEKTTRPFLRTLEFLWQEGHTAHATEEEAEEETLKMLEVYRDFVETELAVPVITGRKTAREKFAGALRTYSIEALMADGRALQAGTSHNLGQHFAKVFDIKFLDADNVLKYVWQTSWGVSTRLIGAIIMVHGDERGLMLPPRVAPLQAVIVPITPEKRRLEVLAEARRLHDELAGLEVRESGAAAKGLRVKLDDREGFTPGWKYNEWEMKGVPVRIEIGPRDVDNRQVVLVRRDNGEKTVMPREGLAAALGRLLDEVQAGMFARAEKFREENTRTVRDFAEFQEVMEETRGFVRAPWCGDDACEAEVKEKTGATIRCLPMSEGGSEEEQPGIGAQSGAHVCVHCGRSAKKTAYFAKAY